MAACVHMYFRAQVDVHRLSKEEGGPVTSYSAEVRIHCVECGEAFAFMGLPWGTHPTQPTVSVGGEEARLPIEPASTMLLRGGRAAGRA